MARDGRGGRGGRFQKVARPAWSGNPNAPVFPPSPSSAPPASPEPSPLLDPNAGSPVTEDNQHWIKPPEQISFQIPPNPTYGPLAAVGITSRAVWSTPLFDLRAAFRAMDAYVANAQSIYSKKLIVGDRVNLFVEIDGLDGINPLSYPEYQFYSMEFAATMDPNRQAFLNRENVSGSVYRSQTAFFQLNTNVLRWHPVGPIRYWGVALVVDQIVVAAPSAVPALTITGALH